MTWFKRIFKRGATDVRTTETPAGGIPPSIDSQAYSSDQPIRLQSEDRFSRSGFARRIADTLAERTDPASIVIGLYGPWGDGKTSTLHLMQEALQRHTHIVCVPFNPWHFQSEEHLLKGFFATLADALKKSLATRREEIGEALKRYGGLLSLIGAGEAVRTVGEALSTVELEDHRKRVESLLEESNSRVVVLIDDVDRLYRSEIQAILKLVKLSASFKFTSYVLSFDDEMVAAAIGEAYAQGGIEAGRSFLEKIVQIPLYLPPADQIALRQMVFDGANTALARSEINLTQEESDRFVLHFIDGIEPQLETPRQAKLYGNALTFALPLLKGEANSVDFMLLEGIRVFYPRLYATIRDYPEYFLKSGRDGANGDAHQRRVGELITAALEGTGTIDVERVRRRLLEVLFPRLSRMGYGGDWDRTWSREQRICSDQYFKRYFTYSVPPGDVSDIEVQRLIDGFENMTVMEQDARWREFAERNAMPQLIRKLREQEDRVQEEAALALVTAIARNGSLLPRERGVFTFGGTFGQGAMLVAQLLRRIAAGEDRNATARDVTVHAEPLAFAFECLRWMRHSENEPAANRVLSEDGERQANIALAERIRIGAAEAPLYRSAGRDAPGLYWLWNEQDPGGVARHLQARFAANPTEVDEFLDSYVGEAWGLESGVPHRADLRRDSYDAIARLIDPAIIAANLRHRYGEEIGNHDYHARGEAPPTEQTAHQFAFIHRAVSAERAGAAPQQAQP